MNRQQAKELLPIIQAFAEGKTIQVMASDGKWYSREVGEINFNADPQNYRIKSEPKYRPFENAEECWQEMQKHQPFGWLKDKEVDCYTVITRVQDDEGDIGQMKINSSPDWDLSGVFLNYTFADGTPFGIKEENQQALGLVSK